MADSIEQKLISSVVRAMQTITTANGYQTDIGTYVEDSRPNWNGDDETEEAISVFEGTVTVEETDDEQVEVERTMPVMIKTFHKRRDTSADDAAYARKVMSDVHAAIRSNLNWTDENDDRINEVHQTIEKQHGIEYAPETFEITGTQTQIEISYYASNFNMEQ